MLAFNRIAEIVPSFHRFRFLFQGVFDMCRVGLNIPSLISIASREDGLSLDDAQFNVHGDATVPH